MRGHLHTQARSSRMTATFSWKPRSTIPKHLNMQASRLKVTSMVSLGGPVKVRLNCVFMGPRRMTWPVSRTILPLKTRTVAHVWHVLRSTRGGKLDAIPASAYEGMKASGDSARTRETHLTRNSALNYCLIYNLL